MPRRLSAVPVVDAERRAIGIVSEADLLHKIEHAGDREPRLIEKIRHREEFDKADGRTATDLMSRPPVVVPRGTSIAAAARLMEQRKVKRLPVVDEAGRVAGIVSRGDLLKVHLRGDDELPADIENGVLRPFLADDAGTVTVAVADGVVTVAGHTDRWSDADLAVRLIRQVPGVVDVTSTLEYGFDDRELPKPSRLYGVPKSPR